MAGTLSLNLTQPLPFTSHYVYEAVNTSSFTLAFCYNLSFAVLDGVIDTVRIISLLKQWRAIGQPSNRLFLDLRTPSAYHAHRILPSTNIPLANLEQRCSELPAKQTPFAVMEPLNARGSTQWLHDRGWICPWVFWEGDFLQNDQLWNDLQALGLAEASAESDSPSWLMFNPCPILESSIGDIEEELWKSRIPSMSHEAFSCLDIGCGSGRDLAWLLSRKSHTAHPMWQAVAVDSSYGAAKRTKAICDNMGLSAQLLSSINAKVLANGQWKLVEKGNPGMTTVDSKKKSNFIPGHPTVDFFSQIVQQKLNSCIPQQYDLIITIRFLVRSLLPQLPLLLKPGGYMILSHFVDHDQYTYDQPRPEHRLQLHELADLYDSMRGMSVIVDKLEEIEDGRPVNSVIIRKDPTIDT